MKTARLSEVCKLVNGGTPKSGVAEYWGGEVAWLTPAEMGKRTTPYISETARTLSRNGLANCSARQVSVGAVIMSTRAPIGHLAIPKIPMAFNQGCRGLIPNETLETKYLYYFLWHSRDALNELGTGATFRELSSSALGNFRIPLPPLEEQRRIVAVLDEAFAAIATATANAEKNLANARELSAMFPANQSADIARIAIGELLERGWLTGHMDGNHGGDYPRKEEFVDTGVTYLSANCIRDGLVDFSRSKFLTKDRAGKLRKGFAKDRDVLFAHNATVGPVALLQTKESFVVLGTSLTYYRCDEEYILPEYLASYLRSPSFVMQYSAVMRQSTRNQVPITKQREFYVDLPSISEQRRIVASLSGFQEDGRAIAKIYQAKQEAYAALKQSFLYRAFTGELTATELQSSDNGYNTPAFTANVIAFAFRRHMALGTESTFGRVKAQKALHLCESVGMIDLGRTPMKDAAGPNDFRHMLLAEDWAKARQFFEFVPRSNGAGYSFQRLARFDAMIAEGLTALKPVQDHLEKAIALIVPMKSEQAELLATVHAAWNNLILDGADPTEAAIIYEARDNWHPAKLKFADRHFREAIATIRTKGIIPDGTAKRVGGQERLL